MRRTGLLLVAAAMSLAGVGCVGTSALRIHTDPDGAKLYVNGKYVGVTPDTVPVKWGYFILYSHCDSTQLRIEKDGYQPMETTITRRDLGHRNRNSDHLAASPYGSGRTYPYTFSLQPAR